MRTDTPRDLDITDQNRPTWRNRETSPVIVDTALVKADYPGGK